MLLVVALLACGSAEPEAPAGEPVAAVAPAEPAAAAPTAAPAAAEAAPAVPAQPPAADKSLEGTVIKRPWSKSAESWMAGGSDYFVLDVGKAPVEDKSADVGVILRATSAVSFEELGKHEGKKVKVEGVYVDAHKSNPAPTDQYPMDHNGNPLPTGAGFEVATITDL